MAEYTTELRTIIEIGNINIFDFTYEKIEGKDYAALEQQFINHYYFREIGSQTVDRFKFYLKEMWLNRIGNYNKMWEKNSIDVNVLQNTSVKQVINDTPMGKLDINSDYASNIIANSGYSGLTEIELLEIYNKNLRDIDDQFVNEFEALFLQIF